jgi:hypothetical protein
MMEAKQRQIAAVTKKASLQEARERALVDEVKRYFIMG